MLFRKNGPTIELIHAGRRALDYAEEIFSLGWELESAVGRESDAGAPTRSRVGIADSVTKAIAYRHDTAA